MQIELEKPYNTKELAKFCQVAYGTFRNNKNKYLEHLARFYEYSTITNKKENLYIFHTQFDDYISYTEYNKKNKNKLMRQKIEEVISEDNRQTGSNIARIIQVDNEIRALDWTLSSLTVYTRENLKELIESGEYVRDDYRWCYLDKKNNKYHLMSDEEVSELRKYFSDKNKSYQEDEENIWSNYKQRIITKQELIDGLGEMSMNCFAAGIEQYYQLHLVRPMKVPTYVKAQQFNN